MKIFVNDKPLNIISAEDHIDLKDYDIIFEGDKEITNADLIDDVLILNATNEQIDKVFKLLKNKKFKELDSVSFVVKDFKEVKDYIKSKFEIIKAAGGLVEKEGKLLLIYRFNKWDLPKGKLEKKEAPDEGAVREVEEECNIKVSLVEKLCSTWHTYTRNGKGILKKTHWYHMRCEDDRNLKPQVEEDIEEARWMDPREVRQALYNTYPSIRNVFHHYYKKNKKKVK